MAVITIGGQVGAGADELGDAVASLLGYDYVERFALHMVARELCNYHISASIYFPF